MHSHPAEQRAQRNKDRRAARGVRYPLRWPEEWARAWVRCQPFPRANTVFGLATSRILALVAQSNQPAACRQAQRAVLRHVANSEIEILLVEDNPADLDLTLHVLRHNRLANRIQVARDGEEALDYVFARGAYRDQALERPLRLVLLDLKLPKVDGLEVPRAIKSDSRMRVMPVVILTSSLEEKDLVESYHFGVNSYIQKPVDFEQFRKIVTELSLCWLVVNRTPPASAFLAK